MLHEYAVAPELVATWSDRRLGRYFISNLGVGTPRIISNYPRRHWRRLAWEAFASGDGDSQSRRSRMEELVKKLTEVTVRRTHAVPWRSDRPWTDNAISEHERIPFHAILVADRSSANPQILVADELDDETPLWKSPISQTAPRTIAAFVKAVRDMLRIATNIVLIDPYFSPSESRFRDVIRAWVWASRPARPSQSSPRVRIICRSPQPNGENTEERVRERASFFRQCHDHLPSILPSGQTVKIYRFSERPGGKKLHNRYVLTEHGGVMFPAGLDRGKTGATDDLVLLGRDSYRVRWEQYASTPPAFDELEGEGEITVEGASRRPPR